MRGSHRDELRAASRIPSGESAKRGVDAFDGASHPPEANCQSKRKTLSREGRRKGNPLSTSINPTTFTFDQLNKI